MKKHFSQDIDNPSIIYIYKNDTINDIKEKLDKYINYILDITSIIHSDIYDIFVIFSNNENIGYVKFIYSDALDIDIDFDGYIRA